MIPTGIPTPVNPHITNSTNASITLMWNYPPPPSEAVEKFLVGLVLFQLKLSHLAAALSGLIFG